MSYSNPTTVTYSYGLFDFGSGGEVQAFYGPAGMTGKLREVLCQATETFNAVTTEATIKVGSSDGGAQYANCGLGTTADKTCYRMSDNSGDLVLADIPADTLTYVAFAAPTGGTPAGMGHVQIIIDWYVK